MIAVLEEISRVCNDKGTIYVVHRRLYCSQNIYGLTRISQEELARERIENNGLTLREIHVILRETLEITHLSSFEEIRLKFEQSRIEFMIVCENIRVIKPTIISKLYLTIVEMIEICEHRKETSGLLDDFKSLLTATREKIAAFYLSHPYRMLELSDTHSEEILTVEACLTPPFIPYIMGELATPKWMVPRTVRTLNDARRIYQTREFMKKEGMELFLLLASNKSLPFVLWKMVAGYAIDVSKLRIEWFDVVTETMLYLPKYKNIIRYVDFDMTTRRPSVVITV